MLANYLVVAHQTAASRELIEALQGKTKAETEAVFTLVVPSTPVIHLLTSSTGANHSVAAQRADEALAELCREGLPFVAAKVGAASPVTAVADELRLNPGCYSGIIIATHPPGLSRWLKLDAVGRLRRLTNLPVDHVTATDTHADAGGFGIVECIHPETEGLWQDGEYGERFLSRHCRVCGEVVEEVAEATAGAWRP